MSLNFGRLASSPGGGCHTIAYSISAGSPISGQKRNSCSGINSRSKGRQRAVAAGVERNRMAISNVSASRPGDIAVERERGPA